MNLTEFLLARIAEDEQVARAAIEPDQMYPWGDRSLPRMTPEQMPDEYRGYLGGTWGEHAARWAVPRVLAECKAKRLMLAFAAEMNQLLESEPWVAEHFLMRLATAYADHPDFDPTWGSWA